MKTYGILLIGCGHIGLEHLLDIYYRDNVRIVAAVDTDLERAKAAAKRCGARWGTDYRPFLQEEAVDIVIIATYTDSHLPILKDCLAAGKHVLCEKPIAGNYEDGEAFVYAVRAAEQKVLVAHILRHNGSYRRIRDLIRSGAIGELRLVRMSQNHHTATPEEGERHRRLLNDCSPSLDCGIHYYDIVHWITGGNITEVTGMGTKTQDDVARENHNIVTFRTDVGCSGYYEVGWGKSIRTCNLKEFIGTKGRITLNMRSMREHDVEEGDLITVYHSETGEYESINCQAEYKDMYAQLATLIDMIENDTDGDPTIEDVWRAFRVAYASSESIATGKTVYL